MYASVNFYLFNTEPELRWQMEVWQKILFFEKCHITEDLEENTLYRHISFYRASLSCLLQIIAFLQTEDL